LTQLVSEAVPGADYVLIPNCGHCPQLHAPGRFVEVLLTFLAEGARPPARLEPVP
jgi:pimeloyl-ACP methyl ester carboxylesterase